VAAGLFEGFWELELHSWDLAAGVLIAAEAGAVVTDLDGNPDFFHPPYGVVAANPFIHPLLIAAFKES
jgi:myo-inositol-1(or 4)-monophosphatase